MTVGDIGLVTAQPGEWVRAPFSGNPLARVELALAVGEPRSWKSAFHDDGDVMIRCPDVSARTYWLYAREDGGAAVRVGKVSVA